MHNPLKTHTNINGGVGCSPLVSTTVTALGDNDASPRSFSVMRFSSAESALALNARRRPPTKPADEQARQRAFNLQFWRVQQITKKLWSEREGRGRGATRRAAASRRVLLCAGLPALFSRHALGSCSGQWWIRSVIGLGHPCCWLLPPHYRVASAEPGAGCGAAPGAHIQSGSHERKAGLAEAKLGPWPPPGGWCERRRLACRLRCWLRRNSRDSMF